MTLNDFADQLYTRPETIDFDQAIAVIDREFEFTPVAFSVGEQHNAAGTNQGSCRLLAFAHAMNLPEATTLALFGDYYRKDVLGNPDGQDHANIRQFMQHGWKGVHFSAIALKKRSQGEAQA
ncbi:HopJ type III effector protein [Saccharospirillum alexandrii]|uniref:HopJ type III effector protein n=1 Tax=Saccharospirillum alexandrii TaxID=2448477 RepID=UPI003735BEEF